MEKFQSKEWDVVIFDYQMPGGITGIDVLRSIRGSDPYVGTIMLTGYPSSVLSEMTSSLECDLFLVKMPPLNKLQDAIHTCAQRVAARREMKSLNKLRLDAQVLKSLLSSAHIMVDDLSEMIVASSHEIETPVRGASVSEVNEKLQSVMAYSRRAHALISSWRSLCGPLADIERFDVVECLKAACADDAFASSLKLTIRCDGGSFPANGMPFQMGQAFRAILQNAVDAKAKNIVFSSADWTSGFTLDNDGRAMDPRELYKVKHGSYSSKPNGHLGTGLPLVRMVFHAHGYQPTYELLPGGGGVRMHATRRLAS